MTPEQLQEDAKLLEQAKERQKQADRKRRQYCQELKYKWEHKL